MANADLLTNKRKEIDARLRELRPLVDEYKQLERASAALADIGTRAGRRRRRRTVAGGARDGRRGRGRRSRATQALLRVRARPGSTTSELAGAMGTSTDYLYRVMATLATEGHVAKQGRGWYPASGLVEGLAVEGGVGPRGLDAQGVVEQPAEGAGGASDRLVRG